MGYTIAMSAKSVQAADEMLAFMGEQFRPGTEILDSDYNYDCTRDGLLRDNHLAYDEGTTKLASTIQAEATVLGTTLTVSAAGWP